MEPQKNNTPIFTLSNIINTLHLINIPVIVNRIFNNDNKNHRVNRIPIYIYGG